MPENYGIMLGEQLGTQAASGIVGMGLDMLMQPWRNRQQLEQNEKLMRQQMEGQKEMGMFNVERQMDLWNRTNAGAQMEHYKKAGLNPALMYGGGGAGGSTAAATSSVGGGMADPRAGGGYSGMNVMTPAQIELMRAQARNLDADTQMKTGVQTDIGITTIEKLKAETANTQVQTALTKIQKDIAEISQEDVTDTISLNAQKIQQEVFQIQNQTDISNATKQTVINTIKQEYTNAVIQAAVMKSGIEVNKAQINKMGQEILQGWEGLDIKHKEMLIEKVFKNESIYIGLKNASTQERSQQADQQYKEALIDQAKIANITQAINVITGFGKKKGGDIIINK